MSNINNIINITKIKSINNALDEYAKKNAVRFHMPGHKGRQVCLNNFDNINYANDVTELFFTDNLYIPDSGAGLIYGLEKRISECFFKNANANAVPAVSYISCGGATLGIQAAVLSLIRNRKNIGNNNSGEDLYIVCDRASHISFINALSLLNVNPLWIYPGESFCEKIECYAKGNKNIIGVFVTSPDYFGSMRDITSISKVCGEYNLPLVVDNSHGSHLAFYKNGVMHPINCGADISVDSVHKTLPALTGAAIIHASTKYNGFDKIRDCLKIFASTSPSFLILQSIENMVGYLEQSGVKEHERLIYNIDLFRKKVFKISELEKENYLCDPYRIVLTSENAGEKLYYYLFENNITCEFFTKDNVIIIPSVFNQSGDFDRLFEALEKYAELNSAAVSDFAPLSEAETKTESFGNSECFAGSTDSAPLKLNAALKMPRETVAVEKSIGRIAAESVFAYPPGIPLVLPGEIINEDIYNIIKNIRNEIDVII